MAIAISRPSNAKARRGWRHPLHHQIARQLVAQYRWHHRCFDYLEAVKRIIRPSTAAYIMMLDTQRCVLQIFRSCPSWGACKTVELILTQVSMGTQLVFALLHLHNANLEHDVHGAAAIVVYMDYTGKTAILPIERRG